ncbi:MAG: threonylcarbamoyl-AMP synthase [Muribaculaceae bacterium]|nr:threonylcarbamoyl-AMP synthase [Muribaculaceae bacterium]
MNTEQDIANAVEVLKKGGVILYPTDTIWGIGCDATRPEAVRRIYEIKRRSDSKALIVLTDSVHQLERYVADVPEIAYSLIDVAVKPMTIVYDKGINLAPELLAGDGSVAVRITSEAVSAGLCRALRRPLVSTSANISGCPSAPSFSDISDEIKSAVDYVMESRRDEVIEALPSSVIKLGSDGTVSIIRP